MDVITTTTIETASAEAPNVRSWKSFVDLINGIWRKGAADYLACGRYLVEAKAELQLDAYSAMRKKLHFDLSVSKKLICIAKNATLSSHVNCLPPCYSTLYVLSQVPEDVLKAAIASGVVNPGMMRRDAIALRPAKKTATDAVVTEATLSASTDTFELNAVWQTASREQRQRFLDQVGRAELCAAMTAAMLADLRDHVVGLTIAGASKSSDFAKYATDKLHVALHCAEQKEPDEECTRKMATVLGLIIKKAATRGITRSDVVVAEGKSKGRK